MVVLLDGVLKHIDFGFKGSSGDSNWLADFPSSYSNAEM